MVLSLPLIQSYLPIIKEKKLSGYFEIQAKPDLTDSDYFNGKYQEVYMKYLNDNLSYRYSQNGSKLQDFHLQNKVFAIKMANLLFVSKEAYLQCFHKIYSNS